MSNEKALAIKEESFRLSPVMTTKERKKELEMIRAFVKGELKENVDYGKVKGIEKPFLFKAGAEHLNNLYGLAPILQEVDKIEDWEKGVFCYTIKCKLIQIRTDKVVAEGIGSCNSKETKYRYIWIKGTTTDKEEQEKMKGEGTGKWSKRNGKWIWLERKPNNEPYSLANTILKMAKKRAVVDATLSATRTSGIFTQDEETIQHFPDAVDVEAEEIKEDAPDEKPAETKGPAAKDVAPEEDSQNGKPKAMTEKQFKEIVRLKALIDEKVKDPKEFFEALLEQVGIPKDMALDSLDRVQADELEKLLKKQFPEERKTGRPSPDDIIQGEKCVSCGGAVKEKDRWYCKEKAHLKNIYCADCRKAKKHRERA